MRTLGLVSVLKSCRGPEHGPSLRQRPPGSITPSALGSSSSALADRALSSLLLIWLPVLVAYQPREPAEDPQAAGNLQAGATAQQHTSQARQHTEQDFKRHNLRWLACESSVNLVATCNTD
jgi:hypothetical protein